MRIGFFWGRQFVLALVGLSFWVGAHAFAQLTSTPEPALTWCVRGDGQICSNAELADPGRFKQVVVLPTGFVPEEYDLFRTEFGRLVSNVGSVSPLVFSAGHRAQILYIGRWVPGGTLGSETASFGGKVFPHPIRGKALTLDQEQLFAYTEALSAELSWLKPWAVIALYNSTETGVTANASPPGLIGKRYGLAKVTRLNLDGQYVAMHELAHASLNFLDEYIEAGFEQMSIRTLDYLTTLVLLNGTWNGFRLGIADLVGAYDIRMSDVLAANGNDNVDVTRYPSRVMTEGYQPNEYEKVGGMFFGLGVYHDSQKNVMGSHRVTVPDDGFGYDHSASQKEVVEQAFVTPMHAARPNDRIRIAGPNGMWRSAFGAETQVLIFDGDKNHLYHPSQSYRVQVGWYDREWRTCRWKIFPYPCYEERWRTVEKQVAPEKRNVDLAASRAFGLAGMLQSVLCRLGVTEIPSGEKKFKLCEMTVTETTAAFLPSVVFPMPYQEIPVPLQQWMTKYYWRFKTDNGTFESGWTGWGSFVRIF